jgi:hypothetical protein
MTGNSAWSRCARAAITGEARELCVLTIDFNRFPVIPGDKVLDLGCAARSPWPTWPATASPQRGPLPRRAQLMDVRGGNHRHGRADRLQRRRGHLPGRAGRRGRWTACRLRRRRVPGRPRPAGTSVPVQPGCVRLLPGGSKPGTCEWAPASANTRRLRVRVRGAGWRRGRRRGPAPRQGRSACRSRGVRPRR